MNQPPRGRNHVLAGLLAGLAFVSGAGNAAAQQDRVLADGREDYRLHCGACHGESGRGDGDMAELLVVPPPDLTGLAAGNDGAFPFWRVYRVVEGREPVKGHSTFQMPLFKDRFARDAAKPGYLPPHVRVLLLTHYIESLQQPRR